ncbi:protein MICRORCHIDIA 6 [Canna indica]|uniref:Protein MICRORCHIDIA 6 n=1 Tax=Canna indica TaxID=4628 RepID=A0AAQ3KZF4_9LILI|nr:protein MICRORCHIDIA 6 [Canna indica]
MPVGHLFLIRNVIDLCSDEETEEAKTEDVKPILPLSYKEKTCHSAGNSLTHYRDCSIKQELEESRSSNSGSSITDQGSSSANLVCPNYASPASPVRLCRQFWKSGDYEVGQAISSISQNRRNRLRIHPKFLHSNATSHKWAFGAIAELVDNAIDETQNGATFVALEQFTNPRDGSHALLIRDDGGGMDSESLRRCMSFGFSDKQSGLSIGQYGNGFKTSTMRLGADVIVFSRCRKERIITQSVGLLSYTFLMETGCDDIIVPTVDYEFDLLTNSFKRLYRHDQKHFCSNLSTILQWSPFITEAELLEQFNDIGQHGTNIIVFNLWLNDDGDMEINFQTDEKDIMINGAQRKVQNNSIEKNYVAFRLQYSLRAYISILYLRLPEKFRIILRGEVVKAHYIANDLIYRECILYRPHTNGATEAAIMTTIGFLEGAPKINVHGFNVYHKNRLILPFWKVANNSYGKGRGVVGVLEANFIKPTHDKQDFEKSVLYQRLESRLKDMTYEYWDLHCHLVGYNNKNPALASSAALVCQMPQLVTSNSPNQVKTNCSTPATPTGMPISNISSSRKVFPTMSATDFRCSTKCDAGKRKRWQDAATGTTKVPALHNAAGSGCINESKQDSGSGLKPIHEIKSMTLENKKLRDQCSEYEEMEQQLMQKAKKLRNELLEVQEVYKKLLVDIEALDAVKMEKL